MNTEYSAGSNVNPTRDISISKDYSYDGDKSIKINSLAEPGSWIRFRIPATDEMIGKTITVKAKILIPEGKILSHLLLNGSVKTLTEIPSTSNEFTEVTLTTTISEDTPTIYFNFGMQNTTLIYLDNFTANIQ